MSEWMLEIRQWVRACLDAVRCGEEWTADEINAHKFLIAAWFLETTDLSLLSDAADLDPAVCALYGERAVENFLFEGPTFRGVYSGEDGPVLMIFDAAALNGTMKRTIREDGEVMFALTPQGMHYVETELLPEIGEGGSL